MRELTYEELRQLDAETYILIDTRHADRTKYGIIPGATLIAEEDLYEHTADWAEKLEAGKKLVFYCQRGTQTIPLAKAFETHGRESYSLTEGYLAYLRYQILSEGQQAHGTGNGKKALIAMSGGVDSSLAAKLMIDEGYECIGCTMKLYNNEDTGKKKTHTCCSPDDIEDARFVAQTVGMPYEVLDFTDQFEEKVITPFISSYEQGRTPNPCIDCNRFLKFETLFDSAQEHGCEYVVTGHYARIENQDGMWVLKKALDDTKDQSYVLYAMNQYQLQHTMFPLGSMKKSDVRVLAGENRFINASKPDSQDICFIPDGDYGAFLEKHTGKTYTEGPFLDTRGKQIGTHKGIVRYTIGQRKGLGVSAPHPLYVQRIDVQNNTVTLSEDHELFADSLVATEFNWISGKEERTEVKCKAKIRYRMKEQPATAYPQPDGTVRIVFDEPQRAITPGQAVVLYDGDIVLGGGRIL